MKAFARTLTPILDSSAGYREKPSHNRMIDSHWVLKTYCPKIHHATYKGRFSISCLIPFHIFRHRIADVPKKPSIPL